MKFVAFTMGHKRDFLNERANHMLINRHLIGSNQFSRLSRVSPQNSPTPKSLNQKVTLESDGIINSAWSEARP